MEAHLKTGIRSPSEVHDTEYSGQTKKQSRKQVFNLIKYYKILSSHNPFFKSLLVKLQ